MQVTADRSIREGGFVRHVVTAYPTQGFVHQSTSFETPYWMTYQELECEFYYSGRARALSEWIYVAKNGRELCYKRHTFEQVHSVGL